MNLKRWTQPVSLLMTAFTVAALLVACGGDKTRSHGVVIPDLSLSAVATGSNLVPEAQAVTAALVEQMTPGSAVTVVGFNNKPGNACAPLRLSLTDGNSEEEKTGRARLIAGLPTAFESHVACMTAPPYGSAEAGSAIFGSIPVALTAAGDEPPITDIFVITEGCTQGEGGQTCGPQLLDPDFARTYVESLPEALKPDLTAIRLHVRGLGQGTSLQAAAIAGLQNLWTEFGSATQAESVVFE